MKRQHARALGCLLCCVSSVTPAFAARWTLQPSGDLAATYQENPYFREDATDLSSTETRFATALSRQTEELQLTLTPSVRMSRFPQEASLNNDVEMIDFGLRQLGTLLDFSGALHWQRDTTLTSETESPGRIVEEKRKREVRSISLGPTWSVSPATTLSAQLDWLQIDYDAPLTSRLLDYRNTTLALGAVHTLSERSALSFSLQAGYLDVPDTSSITRNGSARIGIQYQPWAMWSTSLSLGPSFVNADSNQSNGFVYSVEAGRSSETLSFNIRATRSEEPRRGELTRSDQLQMGLSKQFSERFSGLLSTRVGRVKSDFAFLQIAPLCLAPGATLDSSCLLESQIVDVLSFGRADASVRWRITPTWNVNFGLFFTARRGERESANSHGASLGFAWNANALEL